MIRRCWVELVGWQITPLSDVRFANRNACPRNLGSKSMKFSYSFAITMNIAVLDLLETKR